MPFVTTVLALFLVAVLTLWRLGASWKEGFNIVVISTCIFSLGFTLGGGIANIPSVDLYLVRYGLIEGPVEDAIHLVPASVLGILFFWWMVRKV